jgi:anti-repressor protein
MNNSIELFKNDDLKVEIRVLVIDNKPYFVASDIAIALGYSNIRDAISRHCKGVVKHDYLSSGGNQETSFIPESDVYRLIMRSNLPSADKYERWVCEEVLPSIHKHGVYMTPETLEKAMTDPDFTIGLLTKLKEERTARLQAIQEKEKMEQKVEAYGKQLEYQKPKVKYHDEVLQAEGLISPTEIAKELGMRSAVQLNRRLCALGVMYKVNGTFALYSRYSGRGMSKYRTFTYRNKYEELMSKNHLYWTELGRRFIHSLLNHNLKQAS